MSITTAEAAALLGVSPITLRSWVQRGQLRPLRPGARPLRFYEDDVVEIQHARRSPAWRQATRRAAEVWADACTHDHAVQR